MVCREYEDELRELAAGMPASEREAEMRAHLAGCAACREALEAERRLFAAVDAALGEEMNREVPPSLAARIRIGAAEEPGKLPVAWWRWATAAGMAVAAIVIAVMVARRGTPSVPNRVEPAPETARQVAPALPQTIQRGNERAASQSPKRGKGKPETFEPEVLVLAGEQAAFSQFAESLQGGGNRARRLLEESAGAEVKPLQIAPVEVAELDIKPLEAAEGNP